MFQFPRFAFYTYVFSAKYRPYGRWVSPFGYLRIKVWLPTPRSFSQVPTSFIASNCQGIHRVRLVAWPYNPKDLFKRLVYTIATYINDVTPDLWRLSHSMSLHICCRLSCDNLRTQWINPQRTYPLIFYQLFYLVKELSGCKNQKEVVDSATTSF